MRIYEEGSNAKNIIRDNFLPFAGVILAFSLVSCSDKSNDMKVGSIDGPTTMNQGDTANFSVEVKGVSVESYAWTVDPSDAGTIKNSDKSTCSFTADMIGADTIAKIRVTITPTQGAPVVVEKDVTLLSME